MGAVKRLERAYKRRLLEGLGLFLRAPAMRPDEIGKSEPRAILVARQHNQMGDMLLAVPALRALRERWPAARIGVVSSPVHGDVLRGNPYVDDVFVYDKHAPFGFWRVVRRIRKTPWDMAIALHTVSFSLTNLMLAVWSGAAIRIGSTSPSVGDSLTGTYLNLTLPLPGPGELDSMNEAEHNLYPLRAIGVNTDDLAPTMVPTAEDRRWAEVAASKRWRPDSWRIILHPGAGKLENIWPPERFAEVVAHLASVRDTSLCITRGPADGDAVEALRKALAIPSHVIEGSIGQVAAFVRTADLVICNDTGVMHVCAAVGARTLAIFGKTDPRRWAPVCPGLFTVCSRDGALESICAREVGVRAVELLDDVPARARSADR